MPTQIKSGDQSVETRYELLPLTRNYIQAKLANRPEIRRSIQNKMFPVQNLIGEAELAGKAYRYSFRDMGAETEEEKIAATWALTAWHKYQAGDYEGSLEAFKKSAQIAPAFHGIYRNWALMEANAGFYEKAEELMKKATSLNPNDSRLWFVWGNIEKRRQRYDKAYGYLKKALDISPNDAPILGALGEVEKRRGNFENAALLLLKSARIGSTRWNEIVCFTSLADDLRRWAEVLEKDKRTDESLEKLRQAHKAAIKADQLGADPPSKETLREVSLALGLHLLHHEGFDLAKPYLEDAIVEKPRRFRERKTTQYACYNITKELLKQGNVEGARKYYELGRRSLAAESPLFSAYRELDIEFSHERTK